jgi:putative peptidoglycan lipid II flippase
VSDLTTEPTEPSGPAGPDPAPAGGSGGLIRSSGIVAIGTLASRITGLVRTILTFAVIGVTAVGDGYTLANNTPNMIYDLLLGGILTATLVPVLVSNRDRDDDHGTNAVLTLATVALVVISVATFVLAPLIIDLYTSFGGTGSYQPTPENTELATNLLRLFAPQILFYGLTTLGSSVLNAHERFAAAAFAPVLNNVVMVVVLLVTYRMIDEQLTVQDVLDDRALLLLLGLGTTAGVAAMILVLVPAVRLAHIRIRAVFDWRDPSVREVAGLSGWTLGYAAVNQVALFIILSLAYGAEEGATTAWGIAYIFFQLPYGVFTVSIMTAFTPELAKLHEQRDRGRFTERFLFGLRLIMVVVLPATVGFVLLARPLVQVLLERGFFDEAGTAITAPTVAGLGWGIVGFSLYLYALRAFYTMKDTRTPFLINVVENVINIVLAFVFVSDLLTPGGFGVEGLAWAWAAAYSIAAVVALAVLHRRVGTFGPTASAAVSTIGRMAAAAAAMAAVIWGLLRVLDDPGASPWLLAGAGAVVGLGVYGGLLIALRVPEIREIPRVLLRRG